MDRGVKVLSSIGLATGSVFGLAGSAPPVFPLLVRVLGLITSLLFVITALRIFAGADILPTSSPLPFYIYPLFVATMIGWIVSFWRTDAASASRHNTKR